MTKRCSKCKQSLSVEQFSKDQRYCKSCHALYRETLRKDYTHLTNVYLPKTNHRIYVYSFAGKLHPACPLVVTEANVRWVYCGPWTFARRDWFITKTDYGLRWPVRNHAKFALAMKENKDE